MLFRSDQPNGEEGKDLHKKIDPIIKIQAKPLKNKEYYTYKLVGVVVHNGNAESGHYYSYINSNRNGNEYGENYLNTEKDNWVEFNDSNISQFAFSQLETECFGGSSDDMQNDYIEDGGDFAKIVCGRSKSAYMLVYERQEKGLIPLKVEPANVKEDSIVLDSLDCYDDVIATAKEKHCAIFGKDENKELYEFFEFHNIPSTVLPELLLVNYN